MEAKREGRVAAAYRESTRRFPQGGARFLIFSVLFLAITLGVLVTGVVVMGGAWELEGDNDRVAGVTFLAVGVCLPGFYWWMVTYLSRSKDVG